jgi:hypothetical protein
MGRDSSVAEVGSTLGFKSQGSKGGSEEAARFTRIAQTASEKKAARDASVPDAKTADFDQIHNYLRTLNLSSYDRPPSGLLAGVLERAGIDWRGQLAKMLQRDPDTISPDDLTVYLIGDAGKSPGDYFNLPSMEVYWGRTEASKEPTMLWRVYPYQSQK